MDHGNSDRPVFIEGSRRSSGTAKDLLNKSLGVIGVSGSLSSYNHLPTWSNASSAVHIREPI